MPFRKGKDPNRAPGGKRKGAGRKRKQVVQIQKAAAVIAREYIEACVKPVMATYFQLAHGRLVNQYHEGKIIGQEFEADPGTTRHFVDKLLPDEQIKSAQPLQITFVQFNNTVQLSPKGLPTPVLESNGNGDQASGQGVAQAERQGQDGLKFRDFEDVS